MANVPEDLEFTTEHEWVRRTDDPTIVEVGITDFAQSELGDIVYVELPKVGDKFLRNQVFGTIEAVKAVSELFSPIAGEIVAVNEELDASPAKVNTDPYGEGWMLRIRSTNAEDLNHLLSPDEYRDLIS